MGARKGPARQAQTYFCSAELAQVHLLPHGDQRVAEVVQGEPAGHIQRKPANHEGQERVQGLGGVCILVVGVYGRAHHSSGHVLRRQAGSKRERMVGCRQGEGGGLCA